ncbi:MAG TPA: type II toxin-antitoxin system CcdA family antitoxin [Steroidobacteraceae bacterium]|jgi:post-segregation antitoxin (ccd killing protein)|nr:type II toxin-antitoxin system CcdA family antitoxin [Steroidobacteraceae bacterium]
MRQPPYESKAAKQTVSITLNSDLYAKAKSAGINTSKVAEQALAQEYLIRLREALRAEIREELTALERYEAQHGSFPELVRAHYEREDGAV